MRVELFELKFVKWLSITWLVATIGIFLFKPPFWSLMDDGYYLESAVRQFDGRNLWEYVRYFTFDILISKMGRFQPIYPVYTYLFYGSFLNMPGMGYFFLLVINVGIFWIWARLFERCIYRAELVNANDKKIYRWLFFLLSFLFVPHFNLFFFAGLAERMVILFGAISFYGMIRIAEEKKVSIQNGSFLLTGLILALASKEFALFFIPSYVLWLGVIWLKERHASFLGLMA